LVIRYVSKTVVAIVVTNVTVEKPSVTFVFVALTTIGGKNVKQRWEIKAQLSTIVVIESKTLGGGG